MRCIICGKERENSLFSVEHIFPDAIGGCLTIENVCKDCNDNLGRKVDCGLTEDFLVKLARYAHKIPNKQGEIISPFLHLREEATNRRVDLTIDKKTGEPKKPYVFPSPTQFDKKTGTLSFSLDVKDRNKAKDIVRKYAKRNNLPTPMEENLQDMLDNATVCSERPLLSEKVEFNPYAVGKGMLKIVYEMAYYWLKDSYLSDPIAKEFRRYLLDENMNEPHIRGSLNVGLNVFKKLPHDVCKDSSHAAFLMQEGESIYAVARVFDCYEMRACISESATKYEMTDDDMPYIILDAVKRVKKEGRRNDFWFG